ncbi:Cof-type HAD-IIB family hydrolase [Niallia sp. Man26]|uniref:Cof-type HAD-IIB family hydrolase n=1 Tax=Niallia sp. Man26 TaxID=2912824 RepID=UPI001EDA5123|nr:Cof-type HAD-IIB family hydrolase [Niallia sp. Man26]UPO91067.1 Cof-type HAD-IIB family hydrolase [Niallia sp. Man26]
MSRKLFAFDIDGTLLNSQKKILDSTITSLNSLRDNGHIVMVATGRSRFLIQDILNELELENYIVCNGSAAFLNHQQVYENTLETKSLQKLISCLNEKKIDIALTSLDGISRTSSINVEKMSEAMLSLGGSLPEYNSKYADENVIYQGLAFYGEEYDNTFEVDFPEFRFVRWHDYCVDVIPKMGSKAATIVQLARTLNISREDIITFGDGNNDLEMLKFSGIGIAMGNASELVKAAADIVTESNDEDGIYQALKNLKVI